MTAMGYQQLSQHSGREYVLSGNAVTIADYFVIDGAPENVALESLVIN